MLGDWRLSGVTLYVTLEPCAMCAGAIWLSRLGRVVYGARDEKAGACGSLFDVARDPRLNHRPQVLGGVLEAEAALLLKQFLLTSDAKGKIVLERSLDAAPGYGYNARCPRSGQHLDGTPQLFGILIPAVANY